jgi:hypothetical protein
VWKIRMREARLKRKPKSAKKVIGPIRVELPGNEK